MISNPIKGYRNSKYPQGNISQGFGENPELYKASVNIKSHNGIDIVAPYGTPIYAVEGGLVVEVKDDPAGYGMHVRMLCDNPDSKGGTEWTYGHASKNLVNVGDKIKVGQQIQEMGNTGFVVSDVNALGYWVKGANKYSGTHLHLSARKFKYDKKGWSYYPNTPKITILDYDNGWAGCCDFKDQFSAEPLMGDMEILKRELEKEADSPWYINLFRALRFFGH